MRPGLKRFLVGAGLTSLLGAAPATAARVGWNESAKAKGVNVMTYKVDTLTFDAEGWRAHVTVRNVSHVQVGMRREFGVAFFGDPKTQSLSKGLGFVAATTYSSTLPASLKPGASWTGTIGGFGRLSNDRKIYARVVFGSFTNMPGTKTRVVWITDHAMPITKGSGGTPPTPSGPVI